MVRGLSQARPDEELDPRIRVAFSGESREWARLRTGTDPAWAAEYFARFFHRPLSRKLGALGQLDALECASGYGLNAISFVLSGGRSVRGFDLTPERVDFANELAERLGLGDRAHFEVADIFRLPELRASVVFTLQTLEHIPRPLEALAGLAERAERAVVLSTPNRLFVRDGHDTGLFFAHWLPDELRARYAQLRGAPHHQLCHFLSPGEITETLSEFALVTRTYNFDTLDEWLSQYPCYFPYGAGGGTWLPARATTRRWRAAAAVVRVFGANARLLAPMNEGIYVRRS
ncbi:MAG: class I SAM-dependent methyltransferase [Deltaproteobacteria bacterium]|nr:class I SAM-dependent methyltransferase [Deltaproteobacteria bacterium]